MTTIQQIDTAILRRMTATQKLAVMHALWRLAWDLKAAGVRKQHPSWTDEQVRVRVREIFSGANA